jgi:hypothetical protein
MLVMHFLARLKARVVPLAIEDKLAVLNSLVSLAMACGFSIKAGYAYPLGPILQDNFSHLDPNNFLDTKIASVPRAGQHNTDCVLGYGSLPFFAADQIFTVRELLHIYNLPISWFKIETYRYPTNAPYAEQYWVNNHGGYFMPWQRPITLNETIIAIKEWVLLPVNKNYTAILQLQFSACRDVVVDLLGSLVLTPEIANNNFADSQPTVRQVLDTGAQIIIKGDFSNWFKQNVYEERSMATTYFVSLNNKVYFPPKLTQITTEYVYQAFNEGGWACMDFLSPTDRRLFQQNASNNIVPDMTIFSNLIYPYNQISYGCIVFCGVLLNSLCLSFAIANALCMKLKNNRDVRDLPNILQAKFNEYTNTYYIDLEACKLEITTKLMARIKVQLYFNTLIPNITSSMALASAILGIGLMSPDYTNNLYATSVTFSVLGLAITLLETIYLREYLKKQFAVAISSDLTRTTARPLNKTYSLQSLLEIGIIINALMQTSATNKSIMPNSGIIAIYAIFILAVCNILLLSLRSRQKHSIEIEDIFINLKTTKDILGMELIEKKAIKYAQRNNLDLTAIKADDRLRVILHEKTILCYLRNRIIRDVYIKNLKYSTLFGFCISSLSLSDPNNQYKYTYTALAVIGFGYLMTAINATLVKREIANRIDQPKDILPIYKSKTHTIRARESPNDDASVILPVKLKI